MKFLYKNYLISIFQNGVTSDDDIIFRYTIFAPNGQQIDADTIIMPSMRQAKEYIKERIN